jgi:hypothetical protein
MSGKEIKSVTRTGKKKKKGRKRIKIHVILYNISSYIPHNLFAILLINTSHNHPIGRMTNTSMEIND